MHDKEIPLFHIDVQCLFGSLRFFDGKDQERRVSGKAIVAGSRRRVVFLDSIVAQSPPSNRKRHDALNYHGVKCVSISAGKI